MAKFAYFAILTLIQIVRASSTPVADEPNLSSPVVTTLSPDYTLTFILSGNSNTVSFHASVKTTGYIGFGISKTGMMDGSDLVIGGMKDGKPYFFDYHGVEHLPEMDAAQNWFLDTTKPNSENGTHTDIWFYRSFSTGDTKDDLDITEGQLTVIWSIGETDTLEHHKVQGSANLIIRQAGGTNGGSTKTDNDARAPSAPPKTDVDEGASIKPDGDGDADDLTSTKTDRDAGASATSATATTISYVLIWIVILLSSC